MHLVFDIPYCMFVSGWEKERQGVSYYYLNSRFDYGINKIQVNQNESRTNSYTSWLMIKEPELYAGSSEDQ